MPEHAAPAPQRRLWAAMLAAGMAHALAFAPDPLPSWMLPFVQMLAMACLAFAVWRRTRLRHALALGLLFGLGNFTLGLYWLHTSMHVYGDLPWLQAALAVLALAAFESLFPAIACGLAWRLSPRRLDGRLSGLWMATAWASGWTLLEWLRGTLLTGFPWLNIGYAHVDSVFAGWAAAVGVYGVAWLAAFASATLALLALSQTPASAPPPDRRASPLFPVVLAAVAAALGGMLLSGVAWVSAHGQPILVRLVQGNIPQSQKFDPALLLRGMDHYRGLAAMPPKENGADPDLIILPETVIPIPQDLLPDTEWQRWLDVAQQRQAALLLGIPIHQTPDGRDAYTNSVVALDAQSSIDALRDGSTPMRYDKHHLVPFGEFIPKGFRWFVDAIGIPLGDFDRGAVRQRLFPLAGQVVAPNICYEDVFGEEILQAVRPSAQLGAGATLLVNFSNLAWFGDSWALRQHLQMARMRSMETHRPMLRATNTGMTAAISPNGVVRAALPAQQVGLLDVEVQGTTGLTPYVRAGNTPILAWLGMTLLLCVVAGVRRRRQLST